MPRGYYSRRKKANRRSSTRTKKGYWKVPIYHSPSEKFTHVVWSNSQVIALDGWDIDGLPESWAGVWAWRANSIYDPDYTGGGTAAVGTTTLGSMFNRYCVLASHISMSARFRSTLTTSISQSHTVNTPMLLMMGLLQGQSIPNAAITTEQMLQLPKERFKWKKWQNYPVLAASDKGLLWKFNHWYKAGDYFGEIDPIGEDRISAEFGANPTEPVFWNLLWGPLEQLGETSVSTMQIGQIVVSTRIDFWVHLTEPHALVYT